jgi:hypothetical protein
MTWDAVTGPLTGGQYVAHVPSQFDLAAVSGANEYSVKPLALVRTVAPPIWVVLTAAAVLANPEFDPEDGDSPGLPPDELPQAVMPRVAATRAVVIHRWLRIACLQFA